MKKILFIAGNDTIAKSFIPVIKYIQDLEYEFATLSNSQENAEYILGKYNLNYAGLVRHKNSFFNKYSMCIIGNDWGDEIKSILFRLRILGITSILIQESSVKFGDTYNRYKFSDILFLQGNNTLNHVKSYNNKKIVVGNPRFSNYQLKVREMSKILITINVNFTYGVFENERDEWIDDILSTFSKNYRLNILKHPRDLSNLESLGIPVLGSNADTIVNKLKETKVLITRFSSLIHEALLLGIPVIYYNKFNEEENYDFNPDNIVLHEVKSKEGLLKSFKEILKYNYELKDFYDYLDPHFKMPNTNSPERIGSEIKKIMNNKSNAKKNLKKKTYYNLMIVYFFIKSELKRLLKSIYGFLK